MIPDSILNSMRADLRAAGGYQIEEIEAMPPKYGVWPTADKKDRVVCVSAMEVRAAIAEIKAKNGPAPAPEPAPAKHVLQTVLEDAGYETRSYSGRGMFGKTCLGVSTDQSLGAIFATILAGAVELARQDEDFDSSELESAVQGLRTDALGRNEIVYFPRVLFVD